MEYDELAHLDAFCKENGCSYVITTAQYGALKRAIEGVLQVYVKEIFLESTFESDLGADSIDLAGIFQRVERETGNKITVKEPVKVKTVADALKLIVKSSPYQKAGGTK